MNDKELLELAAKAAGIKSFRRYVNNEQIQGDYRTGLWSDLYEDCWNPLTDDGDALRLAVELHINIEIWNVDTLIGANIYLMGRGHGYFQERYTTDPYAATRRAIVRAAAEIGKEKK